MHASIITQISSFTQTLITMSSVSIFGLGGMGTALASRFLEEKYKVAVWNRSPEKAGPLLHKGATLSRTPVDGIQASNLIIICLLGNAAVKFVDLLVPWLGAMTEYTKGMAKRIDEGKYASEGSNLAMQLVAIQNIIDASAAQKVSANFIRPMKELMEKAVAAGHGGDDISALIDFVKLA